MYLNLIEAYDATYQASGNWYTDRSYDNLTGDDTSSTGHSMDTNFDNHKVPYVYLGTKNHNCNWDSSTRKMTVYGGLWNGSFINSAVTAFTADNASKADGDSDWTITTDEAEGADITTAKTFTAIKTFADACSLKVIIKKPSDPTTSTPVYATTMEIYYKDAWGSKTNAWNDAANTKIATLGLPAGVTIPYVYLGTDDPTPSSTVYAYQKYFQALGAIFDDRVLQEFETSFKAAGFTVEDSLIRYGKPSKVALKEFVDADGNKLGIMRACVYRWTNSDTAKTAFRVFWDPYVASTATAPSYTEDEKTLMKNTLDGTDESVLPEMYVGPSYKVSAYTTSGGYLELKTGSTTEAYSYYNIINLENTFTTANWTISKHTLFTATGDPTGAAGFTATKTTSKGVLTATVTGTSSASSTITVKVSYSEKFQAPADADAHWSDDLKKAMASSMDGYILPFFYIGKQSPSFTVSKVSSSSTKVLTLTGSTWDDSISTLMNDALKKDTAIKDWNVVADYSDATTYGARYFATGTYTYTTDAVKDDEGNITTPETQVTKHITLKLYKATASNGSRPTLEVYYF